MKLLTTNFLTCAVKSCKFQSPSSTTSTSPFPLHFHDATLLRTEIPFQPLFIRNILPRLDYDAMLTTATELSLQSLLPDRETVERIAESRNSAPTEPNEDEKMADTGQPQTDNTDDQEEAILKRLHTLLLETSVQEGKLVCANCGFQYPIKDGVGNFLLPAHLV